MGESPGKSEYELKLSPDNQRIEVYPLDPSKAPSRQQLSQMSVMLFRSNTDGAIDRVDLQPAIPDDTPQVPYYSGRLSTSESNFFGVQLHVALKDGGQHTYSSGGGAPEGPLRALGP